MLTSFFLAFSETIAYQTSLHYSGHVQHPLIFILTRKSHLKPPWLEASEREEEATFRILCLPHFLIIMQEKKRKIPPWSVRCHCKHVECALHEWQLAQLSYLKWVVGDSKRHASMWQAGIQINRRLHMSPYASQRTSQDGIWIESSWNLRIRFLLHYKCNLLLSSAYLMDVDSDCDLKCWNVRQTGQRLFRQAPCFVLRSLHLSCFALSLYTLLE